MQKYFNVFSVIFDHTFNWLRFLVMPNLIAAYFFSYVLRQIQETGMEQVIIYSSQKGPVVDQLHFILQAEDFQPLFVLEITLHKVRPYSSSIRFV